VEPMMPPPTITMFLGIVGSEEGDIFGEVRGET